MRVLLRIMQYPGSAGYIFFSLSVRQALTEVFCPVLGSAFQEIPGETGDPEASNKYDKGIGLQVIREAERAGNV